MKPDGAFAILHIIRADPMELSIHRRCHRGLYALLFCLVVAGLGMAAGATDGVAVPDLTYSLALDQLQRGEVHDAYVTYRDARERDPLSDKKSQVAYALLEAYDKNPAARSGLTSGDLSVLLKDCEGGKVPSIMLERANMLFTQKDYGRARLYYERIITRYQSEDDAPLVYFRRAECYYFQKDWKDAENVYDTFVRDFPNDGHVAVARSPLENSRAQRNQATDCSIGSS